ncbi:MAG: S49 family peptidase [Dehalococcoidia bacterium]|nr:S49 family peptidase [Dehalococcoidia bacterium]
MSDTPESSPPQEPPPPPAAAIPPASPPPPAQQAWYTGPYPPPGIGPAGESTWRMIWRTALKSTVAAGCFGVASIIALVIPLIVLIAIIGAAAGDDGDDYTFAYGDEGNRNKLLSVPVRGVILGEEPDGSSIFGSLGVVYGYSIKETLREAADDSSIDGIILELETPGGTIFGSQAIADGVREYQERTGKPVLAFVAGISASGGMYSMAGADLILADHGSLLGSIGVTMGAFEYWDGLIATEGGLFGGGVTTSDGIEFQPITAGRGKDMGAPYRRLTDEERRILQQGVDNAYTDFVRLVSEGRDIPEADLREKIGALVYDNKTAQDLGLIDGTANRQQAYAEAARLAGLEGDNWQVVREKGGAGIFSGIFGLGRDDKAEATGDSARGICFPANTILAYYGDVMALCAGR